MKATIGEFIQAAAVVYLKKRSLKEDVPEGEVHKKEQQLKEKLMLEIYLVLLEKHLTKAVKDNLLKREEEALLRQFENVLLRYEQPCHWQNFLNGLCIRKRWWSKETEGEEGNWTSSAKEWIRKIYELLEGNRVDECLQNANQSIQEIYYPEYRKPKAKPPLRKDEWNELEQELSGELRRAVLRELFLRLVGRALNE